MTQGLGSQEESIASISLLELWAILLALIEFQHKL